MPGSLVVGSVAPGDRRRRAPGRFAAGWWPLRLLAPLASLGGATGSCSERLRLDLVESMLGAAEQLAKELRCLGVGVDCAVTSLRISAMLGPHRVEFSGT